MDLLHQLEKPAVLAFLVCSMAAIGLDLTLRALVAPLANARLVVVAVITNFVIAPGLAWLLTAMLPLARGHSIGLLLLGASAGAPFLPKLVAIARGDLALAAALMSLLTVGTTLFLPFALPLMVPGVQADPWNIARPLLLLVLLPLASGMVIRHVAPSLAARAAPILMKLGSASLLLLFALLIVLNFRALLGVIGSGALLAATMYFAGLFTVGWLLGGSTLSRRGSIGLATAARNFGAALVPATSSFDDPNVTTMIVVGAIVCLVVSFAAAFWIRRRIPFHVARETA